MTDTKQTSVPSEVEEMLISKKLTVSKKQRVAVFEKSNGACWYCGCDLPKRWHVDHVVPVDRDSLGRVGPANMHLHNVDNMVPACAPCNLFKSDMTIELFRDMLGAQIRMVRNYSVKFRNAERFGLVQEIKKPIVFWFERQLK